MDSTTVTSRLAEISGNRYFVLGAYFFAFFPWAVMSNIDFISEKWRTIRRTRKLAYVHMLSSVVPLIYVAVYAEAQRQAKDEKELGAALAALMFNLIQFFRTVMGKVQLEAFVDWCKHAVECMKALRGVDECCDEQDFDSRHRGGTIMVENVDCVEDKVKVNNTVVDNELGGRDVTVLPSWNKVVDGLKRGEFKMKNWLVTDQAKLSTVRWSGAYLCGLGRNWSILGITDYVRKALATFFSYEMRITRSSLQRVTWNIGEENDDEVELLSINGLGDIDGRTNLSGNMQTAYGCEIRGFRIDGTSTVDSYSFEFDGVVGSYPASNEDLSSGNRERVSVGLVQSVILAKHLGVAKLKAIKRCYNRYRMPHEFVFRDAFELFLKQTVAAISDDSEILKMFEFDTNLPMFPYRMQVIALWEQATNWRVLQASAHHDIGESMDILFCHSIESKPDAVSLYDFYANISRDEYSGRITPTFLGVVLETVRTFLAEWIATKVQETNWETNWEPTVPEECMEFDLSENVCDIQQGSINRCTLIWICQQALQREVSRALNEHRDLPSSHFLIMLFMLGFPCLTVEQIQDDAIDETIESSESVRPRDLGLNGTIISNAERRVNVSAVVYHVFTSVAPQNFLLRIAVDFARRKVIIRVHNKSGDTHFKWQDWVDAAMGIMKGVDERPNAIFKHERTIRRTDLREPIVELCPMRIDEYELATGSSGIARIWTGWPPFDVRICKFEIEQWLIARDAKLCGHTSNRVSLDYYELNRAAQAIKGITEIL